MAGALRKTMVYLGLAEDQARYDDEYYEGVRRARRGRGAARAPRCRGHAPADPAAGGARRALPGGGRLSRITTIHPRTYNEAKTIGENFRDGIPVIMNLTDMSDADAKRLVDFAAGLVFGLRGSIERVTEQGLPALSGDGRGQRRGRPGRPRPQRLQPELSTRIRRLGPRGSHFLP